MFEENLSSNVDFCAHSFTNLLTNVGCTQINHSSDWITVHQCKKGGFRIHFILICLAVIIKASSAPLGVQPSLPDARLPMHVHALVDGGVPMLNSASMGAHLC